MQNIKLTVLLLILITLLITTIPVAADQPGTNEDPFGGLPIIVIIPDGKGLIRFGFPGAPPLPGGVPSNKSGDGSTPRKAVYIGGIWAPTDENPLELPNCSTLKIPAGIGKWFKLDTWQDRRVRIWVDDELDGATSPSGSSVRGAADQYMLGTSPGDMWQKNALDGSQTPNFLEGFTMAVYAPDSLKPMWSFDPPNAALLSVNTDIDGALLDGPDNVSVADATGAGVVGWGSYNPNQTDHLLWYEGRFDGWVFVWVYNQMVWDGTISICSQRIY